MKKVLVLASIILATTAFMFAEADPQFLAADQTLMIMPTAYTMPKGTSAFTNFELFLLQYTYAYMDRVHLSAAMVFPVFKDAIKTFTVGSKISYYREDKLQTALWVSYIPDPKIFSLGHVFSYGIPKISGHLTTGLVTKAQDGDAILSYGTEDLFYHAGFGVINSLSPRTSLITELHLGRYTGDDGVDSLILCGLRFKGKNISWDLGGFRPINEDMGELIALPFVKATILF